LREIAIASKSYWGYEFERVRAWAASIDFSLRGLRGKEVFVAAVNGRLAGWASLSPAGALAELDDLHAQGQTAGFEAFADKHYFADSSLPSYRADAAALLTERVPEFLRTHG
jgi:hypothetical protein